MQELPEFGAKIGQMPVIGVGKRGVRIGHGRTHRKTKIYRGTI
jgi:hypothetical protein